MKKNTFRGRLFALFFVCTLCIGISSTSTFAASNVWGQWQTTTIDSITQSENHITTISNSFSVELWHYSGGYWGNDYVRIYDNQVFDDADRLAEAINANVQFEMPLPQEVANVLNEGYNVEIIFGTDNIPLHEIFNLNKNITFKYENNKLFFNAFPKFNFDIRYSYKDHFIQGLNKSIPFVVAPYGYNRYAIWTKNGRSVGATNGYFNPNDPYELGEGGSIHPSQIINNKGYLQEGLDIYVDRENGTSEWMSSNDVSIGHGTFANAGAVAIHFDYPVTLSFYRGISIANGPDVAVAKVEKTSYPANQGAVATVTVQNLGKEPQETSLDFSIPDITDVSEIVYLEAGETKTVDFYFQTPENGPITMTAHVNKNRVFSERDYSNNQLTVVAEIESPPNNPDSSNCGEEIIWTETDYHTIIQPCRNHGSHSYKCYHTYTYQTVLSTNHNVAPKSLKSGYGFVVDLEAEINTNLISETGCSNHSNPNRQPKNTPKSPTKAELRLNYNVTNTLGIQPYTISLEQDSNTDTTSSFITSVNPISVKNSRSIFTDVALKGTADAPFTHNFDIYVSGGGVNGVEFCKKITESFIINGSMYDDDGTTSGR